MPILDRTSATALLNMPALASTTTYPNDYLAGLIAAVEGAMVAFLGWNPVLTYHTNETGLARYVASGPYAGRYFIELRHQPLVPGTAADIFTKLQLTYPLQTPTGTDVALASIHVLSDTGQVFCFASGAALSFSSAPPMSRVPVASYVASYCAGYSCISDPTNPVTNQAFTNVPPLPAVFKDAALLLLRERLAYDSSSNNNPANPQAGVLYRVRVGEREEAYRAIPRSESKGTLGLGSPLSASAEMLLRPYVKRSLPYFL